MRHRRAGMRQGNADEREWRAPSRYPSAGRRPVRVLTRYPRQSRSRPLNEDPSPHGSDLVGRAIPDPSCTLAGRAGPPPIFIERQYPAPAAADAAISHPGEQPVGGRAVRSHRVETIHVVVQAGGFPHTEPPPVERAKDSAPLAAGRAFHHVAPPAEWRHDWLGIDYSAISGQRLMLRNRVGAIQGPRIGSPELLALLRFGQDQPKSWGLDNGQNSSRWQWK